MTKKKVLVVEDDAAIIEILKLMLSDYEVMVATNGKSAVNAYKQLNPDLVLMDIVMPEMDGVEATKEILKIDPNAKILAITAYAGRRGKEILEAGALEIIEKPFRRKELIERIEKYLS
jgi:two-component system response regulator/two-component system chemotaxis response regulator CheY